MKLPNDPDFQRQLRESLRSADRGARKLIAEELATRYAVSPRTILNYASQRKTVSLNSIYNEDILKKIARRILENDYSAEHAIAEAHANGEIVGEVPSLPTVNRYLRAHGVSRSYIEK